MSTVASCRQTSMSVNTNSRKDSILTRLQRRLLTAEGEEKTPKKTKNLCVGNTSATKQERRVELGWMDFDEKDQRYKQVKAINGGGTPYNRSRENC